MPEVSISAKLTGMGYNVDAFTTATVEAFRTAIAGLARGAQVEWIRLAQSRLNTSRDDYVKGLRQKESFRSKLVDGEPYYEISLVGRMANNFEYGMSSFDMKEVRPGWLGGSKAKIGADGKKYVRIPFRHSTSSSPRFRYTGKAARAELQSKLKQVVGNPEYGLGRMLRTAAGKVVAGPTARLPRAGSPHRYLDGLTRIQKPTGTGKTGQSILMTWRTISEGSPEDSWIHPGLDGANLLPEVERWVDKEIKNLANTILGAA